MKNNQLMIYGAYGYAGELMVREAVAQRLRPIIAGRDAEKLKPIATELSLECRAFGVRNTGSNLQDISVLLNCAGPFSATAEPLARACLAQQIHYLDITGEIDIFRKCHALDEEARQQNVLILPGAGTDIVPTDCLAAMLKEKLPVATRIDLALSFGTNPSIGTVNTMIESFGKGGLIREGGMLKVVSNAFQMRKIPFQNKPQWAMTIPWGDVFTSGISTGVPDGAVYMAMPRMSIYMIRLTNPVKGILNTQFGQKITKRLAGWLMKKGPDAKALEAGRGQFWGEAEAPDGEILSGLYRPGRILHALHVVGKPVYRIDTGHRSACAQSKIKKDLAKVFSVCCSIFQLLFCPPPSGARTLNPNIESVVSTSRTKTKFLSVTD